MPSDTFHRLPDAKRTAFVRAAAAEFAAHGYDGASITRIVRDLGIAKGSVYQYFEDKLDLFLWLVDEGGRRKLAHIEALDVMTLPLLPKLAAMYGAGLQLYAAEPVWAELGLRLMEPTREPRLIAYRQSLDTRSLAALTAMIEEERAQGRLRGDIDPAVAAALVHAMLSHGLLRAWQALPERSDAAIRRTVDQALAILRAGLTP